MDIAFARGTCNLTFTTPLDTFFLHPLFPVCEEVIAIKLSSQARVAKFANFVESFTRANGSFHCEEIGQSNLT